MWIILMAMGAVSHASITLIKTGMPRYVTDVVGVISVRESWNLFTSVFLFFLFFITNTNLFFRDYILRNLQGHYFSGFVLGHVSLQLILFLTLHPRRARSATYVLIRAFNFSISNPQ